MRMAAWLALLALGGLALFVGMPLGWLWIASQVQGATESVGLAVVAGLAGATASIGGLSLALGAVVRRYQRARVARGLDDTGNFPLEVVLVCSAVAAALALLVRLLLG